MSDSAGTDEGTQMDVREAAVIMQDARDRARQEFRLSHRGSFIAWGLALLLGYGTMWLTVRGQRPVHGPPPAAFAVVTLFAAGSGIAAITQARSESGVGGASAMRQRIHALSLVAGLAGMFALEGALFRAGASRPVLVVFEAAAPILVAGLFYLTSSALWLDWPVSGLGIWLVAVAAGAAYAGPVGVWAVGALAGGPAFLLTAVIGPRLRRS